MKLTVTQERTVPAAKSTRLENIELTFEIVTKENIEWLSKIVPMIPRDDESFTFVNSNPTTGKPIDNLLEVGWSGFHPREGGCWDRYGSTFIYQHGDKHAVFYVHQLEYLIDALVAAKGPEYKRIGNYVQTARNQCVFAVEITEVGRDQRQSVELNIRKFNPNDAVYSAIKLNDYGFPVCLHPESKKHVTARVTPVGTGGVKRMLYIDSAGQILSFNSSEIPTKELNSNSFWVPLNNTGVDWPFSGIFFENLQSILSGSFVAPTMNHLASRINDVMYNRGCRNASLVFKAEESY